MTSRHAKTSQRCHVLGKTGGTSRAKDASETGHSFLEIVEIDNHSA